MSKPEIIRISQRILVLIILIGCWVMFSAPKTLGLGAVKANAGDCCGNQFPFGPDCVNCADALVSCRNECGSPFTNACIWQLDCDPGNPSAYVCVCKPDPGCWQNYCFN